MQCIVNVRLARFKTDMITPALNASFMYYTVRFLFMSVCERTGTQTSSIPKYLPKYCSQFGYNKIFRSALKYLGQYRGVNTSPENSEFYDPRRMPHILQLSNFTNKQLN